MPMSPHRPALAGVLLALAAVFGLAASPGDATAGPASAPDLITRVALNDEGTYGGECWPWVQRVVLEAIGAKIGFDYRDGFFEAGAIEVEPGDALPGDIIQIANDQNTHSDADYPGLHTAIVLENVGNGVFNVIDSNWQWDGMVRKRPGYVPAEAAARYGLSYHVYRFTGDAPSATSPGGSTTTKSPAAPVAWQAGDTARVNSHGDPPCLNLRWAPGLANAPVGCLPDGSLVKVLSVAQPLDGHLWVKVLVNGLQVYVASEFLDRVSTPKAPASSAAPGGPERLLPFRTFAPLISAND